MDPFTVLAGATAIYNGLKSAVSAGEDVVGGLIAGIDIWLIIRG